MPINKNQKSLLFFQPICTTTCKLPLFSSRVQAGFPSPADDYLEGQLDLNQFLIKHPAATYFVKAVGNSMLQAGIHSGDILIVDKSLEAKEGNIVIALVDGEFTVKRIEKKEGKLYLMPANDAYQPIELHEGSEVEIWGVVTNVIHPL